MEIKCLGAPFINVFMGLFTLIILALMGIGFILIFNLTAIITGVLILSLSVFVFGRQIKNVVFKEEFIEINFFIKKTKMVSYKECKKMFQTNDGVLPATVYIIEYERKNNIKKLTFSCDEKELHQICDHFFNGFRPKIR